MKLVDYTTAGVHMYCLQYWDDCHPENPKSTRGSIIHRKIKCYLNSFTNKKFWNTAPYNKLYVINWFLPRKQFCGGNLNAGKFSNYMYK